MSGKDEERFEDYLELDRYIQELQAGQRPRPSAQLTLNQIRIYQMVALFRAASPEGAEPRPEFSVALWERLEHSLQQPPAQGFSLLHKEKNP
jgi:hypothetical protein